MDLLLATATAETTATGPDLTAFVGIIGAVVGGAIGLLGQRMNLREQRRREVRERVVDYLREVDALRIASRRLTYNPPPKQEERARLLNECNTALIALQHQAQHIEILGPSALRRVTSSLTREAVQANDVALKYLQPEGISSGQEESQSWQEADNRLGNARWALVVHVSPDLNKSHRWARLRSLFRRTP